MSSNGKIVDEAGYEKSLGWLVERAVLLEDPLLDPAERTKLQRAYDFVEQRLQEYRRGQLVRQFPGLRDKYKILGLSFQEDVPPLESESEPVEAPERTPEVKSTSGGYRAPVEAMETPAKPTASRLSGWLDD